MLFVASSCSGAAAQPLATATATPTPQPTSTPSPTATPKLAQTAITYIDGNIRVYDLSPRMIALVQGALDRLHQCSPEMYQFVHTRVTGSIRADPGDVNYLFSRNSIALSETGFFDLAPPYVSTDDMREFRMLIVLVHESRHSTQPTMRDEPDANAFTLPLFEQCANSVLPENQPALQTYRHWIESLSR